MNLPVGARLGPYEIASHIGAGGMGEVYRAHDARLGRDVAIKILPASLSADAAALARFDREARAIGALNHPNVVNVFDVGTAPSPAPGGAVVSYVVMELLEGETLRARLQSVAPPASGTGGTTPRPGSSSTSRTGGLPRKKALDIAEQIAQGLAAAHASGIVHRDLKPENVFLTKDGRVKVLDFGLARAVPDAMRQMSDAQTRVSPNAVADSVPGMVLGTVGYMAPEQVRGQAVDHRADIFAFGAVLFEMLTGERAFNGDTPIETMSAILKADPLEIPAASVAITGPIEPLLRHCLEKQPEERFQSARDLAFQVQAIAAGALSTGSVERAAEPKNTRRVLLAAAGGAVLLAGGVVLGRATGAPAREAASFVLSAPLPDGVHISRGTAPARSGGLAVSPDGQKIAFTGQSGSEPPQIYVRSLDSPEWHKVPNTGLAQYPAWSPDGRRLAFEGGSKLKTIAVDGSDVQEVADVGNVRSGAAWGDAGSFLYHRDYSAALLRVPAAGGPPVEVLPRAGDDVSWFSPVWLNGARRFLVVRFAYFDGETKDAGIYAGSPDTKETSLVVAGPIDEVAVGPREIYYRRGSELLAQPFDPEAARTTGPPRLLSKEVAMVAAGGGTLIYHESPGGISQRQRIVLLSRTGTEMSQIGSSGSFRDLRLSPDGTMVSVARANPTGVFSIWVYDLARNIDRHVTQGPSVVSAVWTRDSRSILHGGTGSLVRVDLDATGTPAVVRNIGSFANVLDVSADGRDVLLGLLDRAGSSRMATMPLDGSAAPRVLGEPDRSSPYAAFSPDGQWIAFVGREGNARRLFVQRKSGQGPRIPVTGAAAVYPRWRSTVASSTTCRERAAIPT